MIYVGKRTDKGCIVRVIDENDPNLGENSELELIGEALPPRNDLRNHSPDGFEWGYRGSGPSQLALAILAHATGDDETAQKYYTFFRDAAIAGLQEPKWVITQPQILQWLAEAQKPGEPEVVAKPVQHTSVKSPETTSFSVNYTGTA